MENGPTLCSNCGSNTANDRAAGLTYCAACGHALAPVLRTEPHQTTPYRPGTEIFCPFCGTRIDVEIEAGRTNCEACESRLPPSLFHEDIADSRTGWYRAFWLVFLLTPLASLPIQFVPRVLPKSIANAIETLPFGDAIWTGGMIVALVIGAFASGYCLTRQRGHTRSRYEELTLCLGFAMIVLLAYAAFYHWLLW